MWPFPSIGNCFHELCHELCERLRLNDKHLHLLAVDMPSHSAAAPSTAHTGAVTGGQTGELED